MKIFGNMKILEKPKTKILSGKAYPYPTRAVFIVVVHIHIYILISPGCVDTYVGTTFLA